MSVALVITTVGNLSKSCSRNAGPTSRGADRASLDSGPGGCASNRSNTPCPCAVGTPVLHEPAKNLQPVGRRKKVLLLIVVQTRRVRLQHPAQFLQLGSQGVGHDFRPRSREGSSCPVAHPGLNGTKEFIGPIAAALDFLLRIAQPVVYKQPTIGAVVVELVQNVFDLPWEILTPKWSLATGSIVWASSKMTAS